MCRRKETTSENNYEVDNTIPYIFEIPAILDLFGLDAKL